jgi:hypothetical protein
MDALSLDDLLSSLEAAQKQKTQIRLSERDVIELVNKLHELGCVDVKEFKEAFGKSALLWELTASHSTSDTHLEIMMFVFRKGVCESKQKFGGGILDFGRERS